MSWLKLKWCDTEYDKHISIGFKYRLNQSPDQKHITCEIQTHPQEKIEWSNLWVEGDIQRCLIQPLSQCKILRHSNGDRWSPVSGLSIFRMCYFAVPLIDSSDCQIVYLGNDLKTPSLEPLSPEIAENKAILSSSWQTFRNWKTAFMSSCSLLPFKLNIPDCCNCFLNNQVSIPHTIWTSFLPSVFLELCWLRPTERNPIYISSGLIYMT